MAHLAQKALREFSGAKDFVTKYLGIWSAELEDVHDFRELVGEEIFVDGCNPIFKELSVRSGKRYIDYIYEARSAILSGKDIEEVLCHYEYIRLDLRMEDKKYGKR